MILYNSFVLPVLTYNCASTTLTQSEWNSVDAFHRRQLRFILGIFYPNTISNARLYSITNSHPISVLAKTQRWSLTGHLLRLPEQSPALLSMKSYFNAREFLTRRPGTRTSLPSVLDSDLLNSEGHPFRLKNSSDLQILRDFAQDRKEWKKLVKKIVKI